MPRDFLLAAGAVVYMDGDRAERVFALRSGRVVVASESAAGRVERSVPHGSLLGIREVLAGVPYAGTATVVEDASVVSMTAAEFVSSFGSNGPLLRAMQGAFSRELLSLNAAFERAVGSGAPRSGMLALAASSYFSERLWRTCADFCDRYEPIAADESERGRLHRMGRDAKFRVAAGEEEGLSDAALLENAGGSRILDAAARRFELSADGGGERAFAGGRVIAAEYERSPSVHVVLRGIVRVAKRSGAGNVTIARLLPGDVFGAVSAVGGSPNPASFVAVTDVETAEFGPAEASSPGPLPLLVLRSLCRMIFTLRRRLRTMELPGIPARIADFFVMLDEESPDEEARSSVRRFPLTEQDVARWTGLSHAEAHAELSAFAARGCVEFAERTAAVDVAEMRRLVRNAELSLRRRGQLLEGADGYDPEELLRAILPADTAFHGLRRESVISRPEFD